MSFIARIKSLAGGGGTLATLASATTMTVTPNDNAFYVSGSATITSLKAAPSTRNREVVFIGAASAAAVFTHTSGTSTVDQMDLGNQSIVLSANDVLKLFCNENGVWKLVAYTRANSGTTTLASATSTTVPNTNDTFVVTGSATITTLTGTTVTKPRRVTFTGGTSAAVVFTNTNSPSSGQMYLQGASVTLLEQDVLVLILLADGSWLIESTTAS